MSAIEDVPGRAAEAARVRGPSLERYVGWSGLAVVALFGVGNALWALEAPKPGAAAQEIVRFYSENSGRIVAGSSMSLLAIALFVFFASGLRALLSRAEGNDLLATTAFGGALLGVGAGLGAETINMAGALRADDGHLTGSLASALFEISQILGFNAAGVGLGVVALVTAEVALRTGAILPRWLAIASVPLGLALLTPLSRVVFSLAILLLAAISILILRAGARSVAR